MKLIKSLILIITITAFTTASRGEDEKKTKLKPYPLETCLVSGEEFGGDMGEPHVFGHEGREIKLCCKSCVSDFQENTAALIAKVDAAAKKVKPYPLKTCLVSGEEFGGDMGEPIVFIAKGNEVKLCCKSCVKDFNKDKDALLKKLIQAQAAAKK